MLIVIIAECRVIYGYAESHYVIMLSVVILSIIMLIVVMMSLIILSVIMLSVVILSVVILNVAAPPIPLWSIELSNGNG